MGAVAVALSTAGLVLAAEPRPRADVAREPKQEDLQHNLSLGAQVGFYNPNGLAVRAGFRPISLEVAAGWVPTLLSYGSDRNPNLKLIAGFELTPQLLLGNIKFENKIHGAFRVGYRYNLMLGHGATLGGQLSKRWGHLQLEGLWGVSVFPGAADKLRADHTVRAGTSFNFPPALNWGLTVGLMYYP